VKKKPGSQKSCGAPFSSQLEKKESRVSRSDTYAPSGLSDGYERWLGVGLGLGLGLGLGVGVEFGFGFGLGFGLGLGLGLGLGAANLHPQRGARAEQQRLTERLEVGVHHDDALVSSTH
jgi:hypothetical protein